MATNKELIAEARGLLPKFRAVQLPDSMYDEDAALAELDAAGFLAVDTARRLADALEAEDQAKNIAGYLAERVNRLAGDLAQMERERDEARAMLAKARGETEELRQQGYPVGVLTRILASIDTHNAPATEPSGESFIVTIKLPPNPDHNPRAKVTRECAVSTECTDATGEHHTVLVNTRAEVEAIRESGTHITRVETVTTAAQIGALR